jgi:hypothetical protein
MEESRWKEKRRENVWGGGLGGGGELPVATQQGKKIDYTIVEGGV